MYYGLDRYRLLVYTCSKIIAVNVFSIDIVQSFIIDQPVLFNVPYNILTVPDNFLTVTDYVLTVPDNVLTVPDNVLSVLYKVINLPDYILNAPNKNNKIKSLPSIFDNLSWKINL